MVAVRGRGFWQDRQRVAPEEGDHHGLARQGKEFDALVCVDANLSQQPTKDVTPSIDAERRPCAGEVDGAADGEVRWFRCAEPGQQVSRLSDLLFLWSVPVFADTGLCCL